MTGMQLQLQSDKSDVTAITILPTSILKHDKEGFVTPIKIKTRNKLKVLTLANLTVYPSHSVESLYQLTPSSLSDGSHHLTPLTSNCPPDPTTILQVDDVMSALESPACSQDASKSLSSLNSLYKKNVANAMRKTTPPSKVLGGVRFLEIPFNGKCGAH